MYLIGNIAGHVLDVDGFDFFHHILAHMIDAEATLIKQRFLTVGLTFLIDIFQSTGNSLWNGWWCRNVIAFGYEALVGTLVVNAIQFTIVTSILVVTLGMGTTFMMKLGLFFTINAILG